jgi:hypothetical protein
MNIGNRNLEVKFCIEEMKDLWNQIASLSPAVFCGVGRSKHSGRTVFQGGSNDPLYTSISFSAFFSSRLPGGCWMMK